MLEGEKFFVEGMKATDTPVIEAVADFVFVAFRRREKYLCIN